MKHIALASTRGGLFLAILCVAACGGDAAKSRTKDGMSALGSGDAKGALAAFDKALAQMDATNPDYLRASVGRCQALVHIDGTKAREEFIALAKAQPGRIVELDFHVVVSEFVNTRQFLDAVEVMNSGMKLFPGSKKMQEILDAVRTASTRAEDPSSMKRLKDLGYL